MLTLNKNEMKRYRVLSYDFDMRANILALEPGPDWIPQAKEMIANNRHRVIEGLTCEFGPVNLYEKVDNFKAIKVSPISLIAFHNRFYHQARVSFIMGSYYPALTSICALGERVLNHLILLLRDDYRNTPQYKEVYRKESFDDWDTPINALVSWQVLLPKAAQAFRVLREYRNRALHFNPETDTNDRSLALEAILKFSEIVTEQFSGFGTQPWYIEGTTGAVFVKKVYEEDPFVKKIVIPNCKKVGHLHLLENRHGKWIVKDDHSYEQKEITDEEFKELYNNRKL